MKSESLGFLEHLYRGHFRKDLCRLDFIQLDETKVQRLVRQFREEIGRFDARAVERTGRIPDELLGSLKRLGAFGLIVPPEYGGMGLTISEYLRFIEILAGMDMALAMVPLAHSSIGIMGLLLFGNEQQKRRYLPGAAAGDMIFSFALTEPLVGSDAKSITTHARESEAGYILNGTKTYITNANYSGAFTVFAQLDEANPGKIGSFIVERDWQGVSVGKDMPKMGLHASSTAAVRMNEVRVPAGNLIGAPGEGFKIAMTILNYGRLGLGASGAGLMSQSFEEMKTRAASRRQFGVPILDFELIQEKLVRARAHAFAASAMTYFTASLLERDPLGNVGVESSHAKLYGTTRGWDTLYEAMQTAGGSGYLSTLPYEKRMRDFRVTTIFEGTTEIHSVYPPLSLFRYYGELLAREGLIGKLLLLRRISRTVALTGLRDDDPILKEARNIALKGERLFRSMLRRGLVRFGSSISAQELFLRRMTSVSLSVFWLVASISYLRGRHPEGELPAEELAIVEYLTAEAREAYRSDGDLERTERERVHTKIVDIIRAGATGPHRD